MQALELLTDLIEQQADRKQIHQQICKTAAELVPNANLVGLWNFNKDLTRIHNILALDVEQQQFHQMDDLLQSDYPEYFQAIVENELIVAHDARIHSMTRDFKSTYLEPNDIYSLLDFILHKDGLPMGIICCERKGTPTHWTETDQDNLRMLAVMISFYFTI